MIILKKKELYLSTLLAFFMMVLIDWFMEKGFKLFKGETFYQTIINYKIPFSFLVIAFTIVYFQMKKVKYFAQ